MLHQDNLYFHNVVELDAVPCGGLALRRFPARVRQALSPLGRMVSEESAGCEVRFVTDSPNFRIQVGCLPSVLSPYENNTTDAWLFRGPYFQAHYRLQTGQVNTLNVTNLTGQDRMAELSPAARHGSGFCVSVWRLVFGRYPAIFYGLETFGEAVRPPLPQEMPGRVWAAYGSSITAGAGAMMHTSAAIYHAARLAGLDVCNLGLSGSCRCEPEMASFLATRPHLDLVSLEVGVNVRQSFTTEEFERRVRDCLDQLAAARRRAILIGIYPNSASAGYAADKSHPISALETEWNSLLQRLAAEETYPNLTFLNASCLLEDFSGLTTDLIHPGDYGHAQLGHNLGRSLQGLMP